MITLFKALIMLGFEKVAPRTLQRGQVTVRVNFDYDITWHIDTPLGSATYYSQKAALHGLVLRLAISKEELEFLASIGLDYAKTELENFEKTMKRIESNDQKAIYDFLKKEDFSKSTDNKEESDFYDIKRQFIKQTIYPRLNQILLENRGRCQICGRIFRDAPSFYNHINMTSVMQQQHKEFLKNIMSEVTGEIP